MNIVIKNMVCPRCIFYVNKELLELNMYPERLEMGELFLSKEISEIEMIQIKLRLENYGFEIAQEKKDIIVQRIKNFIVKFVHSQDYIILKRRMSDIIAEQFNCDYNYLSSLFSQRLGITIEKYIILQRIERVKELLNYDELNLKEIADKLGFNSIQHLSSQFKKVTNITPSLYKSSLNKQRISLDRL